MKSFNFKQEYDGIEVVLHNSDKVGYNLLNSFNDCDSWTSIILNSLAV